MPSALRGAIPNQYQQYFDNAIGGWMRTSPTTDHRVALDEWFIVNLDTLRGQHSTPLHPCIKPLGAVISRFHTDPIFYLLLTMCLPVLSWFYPPEHASNECGVLPLTSATVLFPVLKEYLFRSLLQPKIPYNISHHWRLISTANLMTSLIFAPLHLINQPLLWAVTTFFSSLVFGCA
jgi:hypothetical protein